jgi:hypothetical protein
MRIFIFSSALIVFSRLSLPFFASKSNFIAYLYGSSSSFIRDRYLCNHMRNAERS